MTSENVDMARETVGIRLDAEAVKALDALAKAESKATGYEITRADVGRKAIVEWLAAQEKPALQKRKTGAP